jgi:hypothetical protein
MSKVSNTNYNHISVKTDSMVKMVKELAKLGVFKSKSKKRAKSAVGDAIRQDSDMVGYTKTLGGPQMRNLPPIQQIQPGMSQSQIDDIQRRNDAVVAALRGEVQQQRLEDIEAQQGQRFADITKLGGIMNPLLERFRGSTFPAEAMGDQPIDPFSTRRPGAIPLGDIPDTQEERFTETLNEGGPGAEEKRQTVSLAEEEEENVPGISIEKIKEEELPVAKAEVETRTPIRGFTEPPPSALGQPQPKIRGQTARKNRTAIAADYGVGPPPVLRDTNRPDMLAYYRQLTDATGYDINEALLGSKEKMFDEINSILDELGKTSS